MAGQNDGPSTLGTVNTVGIDKRSGHTRTATHTDRVLRTGRWLGGIITTADPGAEEEVVVARRAAQVHETGLLGVGARGVVGELVARARRARGRVVHGDLVDVVPEGAKGHVVVARGVLVEGRVDGVVGFAAAARDADAAVVRPGAVFHRRRGGVADGGCLFAKGGYGIVHVVCASY